MIEPKCDNCGDELKEFGGILLSPPDKENKVVKDHLCITCYETIKNNFDLVDVSEPKLTCKCGEKTHDLNNGLCYPCWDMMQ